jgi:hypothetical protein
MIIKSRDNLRRDKLCSYFYWDSAPMYARYIVTRFNHKNFTFIQMFMCK